MWLFIDAVRRVPVVMARADDLWEVVGWGEIMAGIEAKKEAVARVLCEQAGENPDGHYKGMCLFVHRDGAMHQEPVCLPVPNWKYYVEKATAVLIAAGVEFT